jgi:TolB protein
MSRLRVLVAAAILAGSCTTTAPRPSPTVETLTWPEHAIVFTSAADAGLNAPTRLMAVSADEGSLVPIDVPIPSSTYVGQATWAPDGSRIALVAGRARHVHAYAGNGDLYVMNADGTGLRQVTSGARSSAPTWSPDGTQLAFVRSQGKELVVIDDDGTDARVIANEIGYYQLPSWSPDGRWIAFQSSPDPSNERVTPAVYVVRPDGTDIRRLTDASTSEGYPAWSPDSSRIAYSAGERLWVMNADGSDQVQITRCRLPCVADFAPAWAPDGRRIAFLRQEDGGAAIRLYVLDLATGRVSPLTPGERWVSYPRWRP